MEVVALGVFLMGGSLDCPCQVDGENKDSGISCNKPRCPQGITSINFMILRSGAGECLTLAGSRSGFRDLKSSSCNNSREQGGLRVLKGKFFHNEVKGGNHCLDAEGQEWRSPYSLSLPLGEQSTV